MKEIHLLAKIHFLPGNFLNYFLLSHPVKVVTKLCANCLTNILSQTFQSQKVSQSCQLNQIDRIWNLICTTVDVIHGKLNDIVGKPIQQ